jgi:acyl carrier protein
LSAPTGNAASTTTHTSTDEVVATIAAIVADVIGEDAGLDLDIRVDSSFSEDIELESIEFVALAEQLQRTYGERIDLIAWLGELDLDEIIDLTVGELAEFIAACLEAAPVGAAVARAARCEAARAGNTDHGGCDDVTYPSALLERGAGA